MVEFSVDGTSEQLYGNGVSGSRMYTKSPLYGNSDPGTIELGEYAFALRLAVELGVWSDAGNLKVAGAGLRQIIGTGLASSINYLQEPFYPLPIDRTKDYPSIFITTGRP